MKKLIPNHLKRMLKLTVRNILQSTHYYLIEKRFVTPLPSPPTHVIFICKGNVCRSAFAEMRFNLLFGNKVQVNESCGLEVNQGSYPPSDSVKVAAEFSCDLSQKRAKGLNECNLERADLILPMEYSQYKTLISLFPDKKNIRLLREYAPFPYSLFCNINDPYGWGENVFRKTYKLIDKALCRLI